MGSKKFWPFVAIISIVIIWGISFLSIKVSLAALPPMTLALSRFIIASVLLFGFLRWREPQTRLKKKDYPLMFIAGVTGVTLYFYFENNGVKLIPASTASIIISTIPIMTLLAEVFFFGNKLNKRKIFSVIISVIGVYLIVGSNLSGKTEPGLIRGYLMMLGASVAWVIYTSVTKPLFERYSQLAIVCYQTIFGTLAFIPFAIFEDIKWQLLSPTIIWNVVFLGVCCSALGYYFYVYAMDQLGVDIAALFVNWIPVVAVIASYFILHEKIELNQVFGGILVIAAVYLANWQGGKKENISAEAAA